jgi:DNA-binding NtrC family response regulator
MSRRELMSSNAEVLIVHYQEGMRRSLEFLLSISSKARATNQSERALEIARSEPVGVVVTDLRMPAMAAPELTRRLKQQNPDVQIIWITTCTSRSSFDAAVRLRAFDYVEVPFDCEVFLECVNAAVRRHRMRGARVQPFGPYLSELLNLQRQVEEANPIRRWRRSTKMAPIEAADVLGVDVSMLSAWESGRLGEGEIGRIACTIGVPDLARDWHAWLADHASRLPDFLRPSAS